MLEGVFALAGESAGRAGDEQVLLLEVCEGLAEVEALLGRGGGQCALPEGLPDDGGGLQQTALEPVEGVEPGREQGLNGPGESLRLGGLLLQQTIDHLLGEQGVASGALGDLGDDVGRAVVGPRHQRGDQLSRLVLGQWLERDRRGVPPAAAPAGAPLEQLIAGQADEQQRRPDPAGEVVDQVEHSLVGPVDVVDREDEGAPAGDRLDRGAGGGEECLAHALGVRLRLLELLGRLEAERDGEERGVSLAR